MPHEQMNEQQVAAYLNMDEREVIKLAERKKIPCRKTAKGFVFRKGEVDHWIEAQLHELPRHRFKGIEHGVSHYHGFDPHALLVSALIPPAGLAVPLKARTREAVLRSLVAQADENGLLYDKDRLLEEIRQREELCSTALAPGVALPHPRHPLPYDIAESFLIIGITPSGIPFGAADGSLTRLFFLVCSKDDRTHLHVLARLARMLHDSAAIENLLESQTPEELRERLLKLERAALERPG